jgi:1-deoxy-D-xylulose-5-phosphate reductoisomerase
LTYIHNSIVLLGSTGSIGVSTLSIAEEFGIRVEVLGAGQNIPLLNKQIKKFKPLQVIIANKEDIPKVDHPNVSSGDEAILRAIEESTSDIVVNALVGFVGLKPTLKAIECGKKVALANKESLVVAGEFLDTSNIVPIDSEHFGLWYLQDEKKQIVSMTITASGGSFRDYDLDKLANVSIKEALAHPNWSMGSKITIDSATMVNKLYELLEAKWLFNTTKLDAVIETKSIIHALINFADGSTTAHFAHADMKLPIAYAIMGEVNKPVLKQCSLVEIGSLEFREIDEARYPIWQIKDELLANPHLGVVLNAVNEVSVSQFLNSEIGFLDIASKNLKALENFSSYRAKSIEDIFEIDKRVREIC